MSILVSGHRGYVGSRLMPKLKELGYEASEFLGDVTSASDWKSNIAGIAPNVIVHLAALNNLRECEGDPDHSFYVNYLSAFHAGLTARALGAKLVFTITTTAPEFDTVYERDRFSAAVALNSMRGLNYSILNMATVYGDSPVAAGSGRGIINSWIQRGLNGEKIVVYREVASKYRHFVYVGDVVNQIIESFDAPTGLYDVWPTERLTMLEAATEIGNYINAPVILSDSMTLLYPVELRSEVLEEPGWINSIQQWTKFAEGMRLTVEALRKGGLGG